jgi:hypothetical protein
MDQIRLHTEIQLPWLLATAVSSVGLKWHHHLFYLFEDIPGCMNSESTPEM